jgi:hypothetical protein
MAQPTNTFDTYDAVGIREDLSNVIYSVTPDDTPLYTACKKTKATNTIHEWQTDTLRSSAVNAHIEGGDTSAGAVTPTVRLRNYTQIFKNAVVIADTEEGVENQEYIAGDSSTARKLAGLGAWIKTNESKGTGGAAPAGTGVDKRTDGTQAAFDQTKFDSVMESIWTNGGNPDRVYLSPFQMNKALDFTGNNNQRSTVQAGDSKVVKSLDVYVTPWGTVEFMPSRENRSRDVYILQNDMFNVAVLRPTKSVALAKTGDSTMRQILTELTLTSKNEAASGIVADLTTS